MATKTSLGNYKGNPTISLDCESRYPFSFGLGKAKLILEHIEAIKAFVARHEQGAMAPGVPRAAVERFDPMGVDRAYEDS